MKRLQLFVTGRRISSCLSRLGAISLERRMYRFVNDLAFTAPITALFSAIKNVLKEILNGGIRCNVI